MFYKGEDTTQHLDLYRDILAMYKKILENSQKDVLGIDGDIIKVKSSLDKTSIKAPLILISRADLTNVLQFIPQNQVTYDASISKTVIGGSIFIDYPIQFETYGNNYLECDRLSTYCMEMFVSTSLEGIKSMHPNIDNAIMQSWSSPKLLSQDSGIIVATVTGLVRMNINSFYIL